MVFAAINACPVRGGKLKGVDESVLSGTPGIVGVVKLENAVAVVATDSFWRAKRALSRLQPEWDVGAAGRVDSEQLSKEFRAALTARMVTARNDGDVDKAMSGAAKTFEAIYETPYLSHSPMEPMNATVNLQPDRLDVWVGTQDAEAALGVAARVSGLKPEQVHIHNAFLGGGFGRRDASDEIAQAIAIAKVVKRPVKLIWTREEDTRQDRFRPHAVVAFKAATGSDGMPTAWSMRVVTSSIFKSYGIPFPPDKAEPPAVDGLVSNGYNVPNTRVELLIRNTHLPVWFYRAPGANQHVFAIESFLDEIASASRYRSLSHAAQASRRQAGLAQGVGYRRRERRLGQAAAERQRTRHRDLQFYGQSLRAGRRSYGETERRCEGRSGHRRARYPSHGQSADHRRTG